MSQAAQAAAGDRPLLDCLPLPAGSQSQEALARQRHADMLTRNADTLRNRVEVWYWRSESMSNPSCLCMMEYRMDAPRPPAGIKR